MSKILKISDAAAMAIHACVMIGASEKITAREIADKLDISQNHLAKVLQRLVKTGIISSETGPKGGFRLSIAPGTLYLKQIYESIEGPLTPERCLFGKSVCAAENCILGKLISKVSNEVIDFMTAKTVSDLIKINGGAKS